MEPIKFKGYNVIFAEDQPQYTPLPAFKSSDREGQVISCWRLSLVERLIVLFNGRIWLSLMSFHRPLTPSYMTTKKSDVLIIK